jgi:HD-GYP domain-containing protein (c-di-GMP phosphodiesterase class II)
MSESSLTDFKTIPIAHLPIGGKLREPIYEVESSTGKDLLLLASGHQVTEGVVDQLIKRGVSEVRVSLRELRRMQRESARAMVESNPKTQAAIKRAAQEELRGTIEKFKISVHSQIHQVKQHGTSSFKKEKVALLVKDYEKSNDQVALMLDGICAGTLTDSEAAAQTSEKSLDHVVDDMDLVVALGLTPAEGVYSSKHSLQTAMLAMAVGTSLGLKRQQLVEMGIGCLVHDAGMRLVPQDLVLAPRQLTQIEFLEITKHCSITFELLQKMADVPTGARMVAYQLHERFDGSGYPRQRHGAQIHPLSRIAMVADTFVAMISPRPHRPPLLPYKAMEFILHSTKLGKFDPDVVRGLLQTVGLFPIGSYVLLSDDRTARVIRAHRELFNRPVVEIQPPEGAPGEPEVLNLASAPGLEIVRALPIPPQALTAPVCAAAG